MARRHKKEVYHFVGQLKAAKTFGMFMEALSKFGAREVGKGTSRKAWVWGNYVVKASSWHYDENEPEEVMVGCEDNQSEVKTYLKANRHLKKLMAKVYSELSEKDGKFVVMEYVPNGSFRFHEVEKYLAKATKVARRNRVHLPYCIVHDAHGGNFRKRANGKLVMIDLQDPW